MTSKVRSSILQDDQKFALMKFRRNVSDILKPEHDDYFLLRWLRAREWNAENAEKMLRDSQKWRERWGVDDIVNWETPAVLRDYTPHGHVGYDKEGSPIIVVPFAGMDMVGMLHTVSRADFIRATIQNLEYYMRCGLESSKNNGDKARQFIVLFDMEGFSLKQYAWRPAGEVVITLIKQYEANYPEILKTCYIINVPRVFALAFGVVKKFLDEYTLSKILIFKQDSKKWEQKLFDQVDRSQIPAYFGGTLTSKDGDPRCQDIICWGGKIPLEMYTRKTDDDLAQSTNLIETVIKKGDQLVLNFRCEGVGCFLKWEFRTYDHDIRFGITSVENGSKEVIEQIPLKRVAAHQLDEEGFIACQPDCVYTVVFDNSYSYFKSKRLRYAVTMTTPIDDCDEALDDETSDII